MTEKRYVKENFYNEYAIKKEDIIIAIVDSGSNARKICDELNALHEENKALKSDRARYEEEVRLDVFKELYEENQRLKEDELYETLSERGNKLIEENERLHDEINILRNIIHNNTPSEFSCVVLKKSKERLE